MTFVPRQVFPKYLIPLSNFKGHHQKALTRFGHLAPQIDVVLEVRDCRAPVSTTNHLFDKILARKSKIILYSKKDLGEIKQHVLDKWHVKELCLFIDCRDRSDIKKVLKILRQKYSELIPPPPLGMRAMIIGMPNVGKSTLVNTLRQVGHKTIDTESAAIRKVAQTGGQPGVTRNTSEIIRVSKDPNVLVYDTPGVFLPTVKDVETMLSLAIVGCVPPAYIDPVIQADYLLFLLNLQDPAGIAYDEYLDHPTNSINELLFHFAKSKQRLSLLGNGTGFDETAAALMWVDQWRKGKFSKPDKRSRFLELPSILASQGLDLKQMIKLEKERVDSMDICRKISDISGSGGIGRLKNANRTAKDRQYDLRNQLFKL